MLQGGYNAYVFIVAQNRFYKNATGDIGLRGETHYFKYIYLE